MISKQKFKSQLSRISLLFMRKIPSEMGSELYEIFKNKEFEPFEKAISDIIRQEDRFPTPHMIQTYYETHVPDKEPIEPLTRRDLEKAAKTQKHKEYLKLVFGLMDGEIDIEEPGVQLCLQEQGNNRVYSHYDKEKRCFVKVWRKEG